MTGIIKRIYPEKKFGFILSDEDGKDYFFHKTCISREIRFDDLTQGARVVFEGSESEKGLRALDVTYEGMK